MYLPYDRKEVKIEKFINLREGNMSAEEYSSKFTVFSRYATSFVSNPRDTMSRFLTGVSILVKE